MLKLALVGKDVSKSLSPQMHSFLVEKLGKNCSYQLVSVSEDEFEEKIEEILAEFDGLNVTIPYKLSVMKHLKEIKGDAKDFGAVNTVLCKERLGFNTDGEGFMLMLQNEGVEVREKKVLVLGVGGAGRAVVKKIAKGGGEVFAYQRNQENLLSFREEFPFFTPLTEIKTKPYDLIINCTSVGMHQSEGVSPVGEELLSRCVVAVDLIYHPKKSEFLRLAEKNGKKIVNGEAMLFYQAYFADCLYMNLTPDSNSAKQLFEEYQNL